MINQPYLRINIKPGQPGRSLSAGELAQAMAAQLGNGGAAPGCRLPPVRALALQLGISKNTVQSAYDELVARGVAESRRRVGLFVAEKAPAAAARNQRRVPAPKMVAMGRSSYGGQQAPLRGIPLSAPWIDPDLLPKERVASCFRSVLKQPGLSDYQDLQGYPPLRRKIAERLRKRGIPAEADDVVLTAGSQQGMDLVCRSLKRKVAGIESPSYGVSVELLEVNGIEPVLLPVDPFAGVDLDAWVKALRKARPGLVYLTTNFCNPTGYSYSSAEIDHILALAGDMGFGILEDDWGSDMMSFSELRPSFRALGGDGVCYVNSFTKKLLPSLRLGYLVGNEAMMPNLLRSKAVACQGLSSVVEMAVFEFLDRGYYDVHLKALQAELDVRYRKCLEVLRQTMPAEVRWGTPGGGPSLWLEVPKRVDLEDLRQRLDRRGVRIRTGAGWFSVRAHLHGLRIGYGRLNPEEMARGVGMLAEELKRAL